MISAFGIDHGDVSKRLPSALRGGVKAKTAYGRAKQLKHAGGRASAWGIKSMGDGKTAGDKVTGFMATVGGTRLVDSVHRVTHGM